MDLREEIRQVAQGGTLSCDQMRQVMRLLMSGEVSDIQAAALLTALAARIPTVDELTGAVEVMRELVLPVEVTRKPVIDTCGTGGSHTGLFNISTAAAFVIAAAEVGVAKHGNRAMTGSSGSADLLERAGAELSLKPEQIARCVDEVGFGFISAQVHHAAVRYVAKVRSEIGVRTIFNMIGPLSNPAGVTCQLLGVPNPDWQEPMIEVLKILGSERVLIVCCQGLDELGLNAPSSIVELKEGQISRYQIEPEDFGLKKQGHDALVADSPKASLALVKEALSGKPSLAADIVALNAGAAIYLAKQTRTIELGVQLARDLLASGQARQKMTEFIEFSQILAHAEPNS